MSRTLDLSLCVFMVALIAVTAYTLCAHDYAIGRYVWDFYARLIMSVVMFHNMFDA